MIYVDEQDAISWLRKKLRYSDSVRGFADTTLNVDEHQY